MKRITLVLALALLVIPAGMAWSVGGPMSIYDLLEANADFSTLKTAVDKANVKDLLMTQVGPFTMFAPTNAAFAKLPPGALDKILADPQIVKNVVYYHIIPGLYMAKDLPGLKECKTMCPTTEAQPLKLTQVGDRYMVGSANIVKADMKATNGVVHAVDTVFLPKSAPPKLP